MMNEDIGQGVSMQVTSMAREVEVMVNASVEALLSCDQAQAVIVLEKDEAVNGLQEPIDDEIFAALGYGTTSRRDVRQAVAIFRINNDMRRLAETTTGIARKVLSMSVPETRQTPELQPMAIAVSHIARKTFRSFLYEDIVLARNVMASGSLVDDYRDYVLERLQEQCAIPAEHPKAAYLMLASRYFEQIAGHCTSLTESVIFWLEGEKARGKAA